MMAAAKLPKEVRRYIVREIEKTIIRDEAAQTAEERLAQLVPVAECVLHMTYDPARKSADDVCIRNLCADAMRREGYTFDQIGRAMGRDHSSVVMMVRRAADMKAGYSGKYYKRIYDEFKANTQL